MAQVRDRIKPRFLERFDDRRRMNFDEWLLSAVNY